MSATAEKIACPVDGCDYTAKTQGAITVHTKKVHAENPLDVLRGLIPGAPRPGGAFTSRPLRVVPTGVPSVDYATEVGGAPRGTIIEVFGPPASGKTLLGLTFSAFAQMRGGRAGFMDTERALQPTFLQLVPGLDAQALEYGTPPDYRRLQNENRIAKENGLTQPYDEATIKKMIEQELDGSGEAALETTRRFIETGMFDVWTFDSVYHATPRSMINLPVGHKNVRAALAQLMGQGLQVLETSVANTDTLAVFINHQKSNPNAGGHGVDWTKPAGAAFDYAASMQLQVRRTVSYTDSAKRRIGHRVKVKLHKSKVNAPQATAEFDLFYKTGTVTVDNKKKTITTTGVDIPSSWLSVAKESGLCIWAGNRYANPESGEVLGSEDDVREMLADEGSPLRVQLDTIVYPEQYR